MTPPVQVGSQDSPIGVSCYSASKGIRDVPLVPVITPAARVLPGKGKIKDENCGAIRRMAVCSADIGHDKKIVKFNCGRLECPECFTRVLSRNSERVASRVEGYRQALSGQRTLEGCDAPIPRPPRHGIVSPPASVINAVLERSRKALERKYPEGYTSEELQTTFIEKFRYEVYKVLQASGIAGAAVIIHLDRVTDRGIRMHRAAHSKESRWKWILRNPEWRNLIYFSPHVHIMFYGYVLDTGELYDKTGGWVFKNKREIPEASGLAYYLLSHAPLVNNRLTVTYWGCLSPRKLRCVKTYTSKEEVLCETCQAVMVYASFDAAGNITEVHPDRPFTRKITHRDYVLVRSPGPGTRSGPGRGPGPGAPWSTEAL